MSVERSVEELKLLNELEALSSEELVKKIVKLEWEAFDKVNNEGGRASCQNDWDTFEIMRKSQYNVFTKKMLVQYAYDFIVAVSNGRNLITEKYARMEESTAKDKWEEIKDNFPVLSDKTKAVIEQIVKIQVGWMEEFAKEYPALAMNARTIHTSEDSEFNTSYETYLRGELSTYTPEMLGLYGEFVVGIASNGGNLARMIIEQTVLLNGYESLEAAAIKAV